LSSENVQKGFFIVKTTEQQKAEFHTVTNVMSVTIALSRAATQTLATSRLLK
jgi:hypothetical protein